MLKKLKLSGFQSHGDSTLELSPGVNTIVGDSDCGKSAIVRSLYWLFFNRPSGASFVKNGSDNCSVLIETEDGVVERIRKPVNGYSINGGKPLTAIGTSVPKELESVAKIDATLNFQLQLEPYFLVLDSSGQMSRRISDILGFSVIDKAVAKGKQKVSEKKDRVKTLTEEQKQLAEKLEKLEELAPISLMIERAKAIEEEIETLSNSKKGLVGLIDSVKKKNAILERHKGNVEIDFSATESLMMSTEELVDKGKKLGYIISSLKDAGLKIDQDVKSAEVVEGELEAVRSTYINTLREIGVCPYCWSSIEEETLNQVTKHI